MADNGSTANEHVGTVEQVTGVVIDVVFPDHLPEIFHALEIEIQPEGGRTEGTLDSARCSSTSATTASARSRWTRPTASSAATR